MAAVDIAEQRDAVGDARMIWLIMPVPVFSINRQHNKYGGIETQDDRQIKSHAKDALAAHFLVEQHSQTTEPLPSAAAAR